MLYKNLQPTIFLMLLLASRAGASSISVTNIVHINSTFTGWALAPGANGTLNIIGEIGDRTAGFGGVPALVNYNPATGIVTAPQIYGGGYFGITFDFDQATGNAFTASVHTPGAASNSLGLPYFFYVGQPNNPVPIGPDHRDIAILAWDGSHEITVASNGPVFTKCVIGGSGCSDKTITGFNGASAFGIAYGGGHEAIVGFGAAIAGGLKPWALIDDVFQNIELGGGFNATLDSVAWDGTKFIFSGAVEGYLVEWLNGLDHAPTYVRDTNGNKILGGTNSLLSNGLASIFAFDSDGNSIAYLAPGLTAYSAMQLGFGENGDRFSDSYCYDATNCYSLLRGSFDIAQVTIVPTDVPEPGTFLPMVTMLLIFRHTFRQSPRRRP
jgi:hypothetical protein